MNDVKAIHILVWRNRITDLSLGSVLWKRQLNKEATYIIII